MTGCESLSNNDWMQVRGREYTVDMKNIELLLVVILSYTIIIIKLCILGKQESAISFVCVCST